MHIYVSRLDIIGPDNGLSPGHRQAIIWTNAEILPIWHLGTNFSEMLIKVYTFSFKKMHVTMLSAKRWPFCLGLSVLKPNLTSCCQQADGITNFPAVLYAEILIPCISYKANWVTICMTMINCCHHYFILQKYQMYSYTICWTAMHKPTCLIISS